MKNFTFFILSFLVPFSSLAVNARSADSVCSLLFTTSIHSAPKTNQSNGEDSNSIKKLISREAREERIKDLYNKMSHQINVPSLDIVASEGFSLLLDEGLKLRKTDEYLINNRFLIQVARMLKKGEFNPDHEIRSRSEAIANTQFRRGITSIINYMGQSIERNNNSIDPSILRELLQGLKSIIGPSVSSSMGFSKELQDNDWFNPWYYSISKYHMPGRLLRYILFEPEYTYGLSEPFIIKTRNPKTGGFGYPHSYVDKVLTSVSYYINESSIQNPIPNPTPNQNKQITHGVDLTEFTFDYFLEHNMSYYEAARLSQLAILLSMSPRGLSFEYSQVTSKSRSNRGRFIKNRNELDPSKFIDIFDLLLLAKIKGKGLEEFRGVQSQNYDHSANYFLIHYLLGWDLSTYNAKLAQLFNRLETIKVNGEGFSHHLMNLIAEDLLRGVCIKQFSGHEISFYSSGSSIEKDLKDSIHHFELSIKHLFNHKDNYSSDFKSLSISNFNDVRVISRSIELLTSIGIDSHSSVLEKIFEDYLNYMKINHFRSSPSFAPYILGLPTVRDILSKAMKSESGSPLQTSKVSSGIALFTFGQPVP